jgi:aryl-alcohol dehydrogenase-like predicted oxidoreductase
MEMRTIGSNLVFPIGLGEMLLSIEGRPDENEAIKVIHSALDNGINFIDTADAYCLDSETEHGHGERLVKKALDTWSGDKSSVLIATKGGKRKPPNGPWPVKGDPSYLKQACENSLKNLGVDSIALYQLHQPDPNVPLADSLGVLAELQNQGKILQIGLSNVDITQITEAMGYAPIISVQNKFSIVDQSDREVVDQCNMFGLAYIAYSPLGGSPRAKQIETAVPGLKIVAQKYEVSPQQVALAWLLAYSPYLIPIPSARRVESVLDSIKAVDLNLSPEDLDQLNNQQ